MLHLRTPQLLRSAGHLEAHSQTSSWSKKERKKDHDDSVASCQQAEAQVTGQLPTPPEQVLRLDVTGPASTHYSALTAALRLVPLLLPESDPTNGIPPCM